MSDLLKLAKPVPASVVKQKPGSFAAAYVSHSEVSQSLLGILGPHSITVSQIIYNGPIVEGAIVALTCTVDGKEVTIEEAGATERRTANAGERMKDCVSDGIKRCAMRLGLGLHLWAGDSYYLYNALEKKQGETSEQ